MRIADIVIGEEYDCGFKGLPEKCKVVRIDDSGSRRKVIVEGGRFNVSPRAINASKILRPWSEAQSDLSRKDRLNAMSEQLTALGVRTSPVWGPDQDRVKPYPLSESEAEALIARLQGSIW